MKRMPWPKIIFLSLICLLLLLPGCVKGLPETKLVESGYLDLPAWDFQTDGNVKLDGDWEFYWNQLIGPGEFEEPGPELTGYYAVPLHWTKYRGLNLPPKGYATYRAIVQTNGSQEVLSIKTPEIYTEYSLWINGEIIDQHGSSIGKAPRYLHPHVYTFSSSASTLEIILQVQNVAHRNAGIGQSFVIGTPKNIYSERTIANARDLIIFAVCLFAGCYHLILFFYQKYRRDLGFFAVFCIAVALRGLISNETFVMQVIGELPFVYGSRFLTMLIPLITISALLFTYHLYPKDMPKVALKIIIAINMLYLILVCIIPTFFYTSLFNYYLASVVASSILVLFTVVRAYRSGSREAIIFLVGTLFFVVGAYNDMLFYNQLIATGYHLSLGLAIFIMAQSGLLAIRFNKAFIEKEELAQRLQATDRARNELMAITAHELCIPVNSIVLMADRLHTKSEGMLSEKQMSIAKSISTEGRQLSNLVNDILYFATNKKQDIKLVNSSFDIYLLVHVIVRNLKPLADAKSLSIHLADHDQELFIYVDKYRLTQVIQNLVDNAIKFTPTGGKIEIKTTLNNNNVYVSVQDNGIGIGEEKLADIFKSYEQVDDQISHKYGGMGLGLSIAMQLARAHGGDIHVKSRPGGGSVFTLILPYIVGEKVQDENLTGMDTTTLTTASTLFLRGKKPETIVIIDDSYNSVMGVADILRSEGFTIKGFIDPHKGLSELLKGENAVLGIIDLMMPEMTGDELCSRLRERFSLFELPILILSSRTQTNSIVRALQMGANDFLQKPFEIEELIARVQTLVHLKMSADRAVGSELAFMQAQIKPHFIYNALGAISNMTIREPQKAKELLLDLADYLRGCFSFEHTNGMTTLAREMEVVRAYLSIEKARFRERLQVEYQIDGGQHMLIPMLIIQPLVENAVLHGLMPKLEGGTIKIKVWNENGSTHIRVEDDGVGISAGDITRLLGINLAGRGVGLKNVQKRLIMKYGQGLQISSTPGAGAIVEAILPAQKEGEKE